MRVVMARDLGDAPREQMAGARWLVFTASEIPSSTTLLMFTELDDILVAVDHRGSQPPPGLWQRAVHCILIDGSQSDADAFRRASGITKVITDATGDIRDHLW
ncbi:MAG: hypothetical protein DWC04_06625 [Candidatus Poseidoniales archaeon]|nr:MAG: hypothetical protein DWC04_06625 [Candidatus Poseidoniales archaeon]